MDSKSPEREFLTLFVGEGDFSFSAQYVVNFKRSSEKVIASCFSELSLTERQQRNIKIIKENGDFVYCDVDATSLELHPYIKQFLFSKIFFNFPHIPGKMNIKKNRQLVESFFKSARKVLKSDGTVIVTLCQGQGGTEIEKVKRKWCDTWQIVSLAASASLILHKVFPFDAEKYETYQCTGFRGHEKPFNTKGALVHIFKCGDDILLTDLCIVNYFDVDLYLQNCRKIYKKYRDMPEPCHKVLFFLEDIAKKTFHPVDQQVFTDLLNCKEIFGLNFPIDCDKVLYLCEDCTKNIFYHLVEKENISEVISYECVVCCLKHIEINKLPFNHLKLFISDDADNVLDNLSTYLKYLNQVYSTVRNSSDELIIQNEKLDNNINQTVTYNSAKETASVTCVLNLYATYLVIQGNEFKLFSNVKFFIGTDTELEKSKFQNVCKIGAVLHFHDNVKNYLCVLFDIITLACLKFHIMDPRILLFDDSFFSSETVDNFTMSIFRPLSLYPPTYEHDVSFYVNQDFCENDLFLVIRNAIGVLVKSVTLIDSYYDENVKKYSRCYHFVYQSCNQALSKHRANVIHTEYMRRILQKSLNITLR